MWNIFLECNTSTFEGFEIESETVVNTIYWPFSSACGSIQYQWLTLDVYIYIYVYIYMYILYFSFEKPCASGLTHPAWRDIGNSVTCQCNYCWFATLTCVEGILETQSGMTFVSWSSEIKVSMHSPHVILAHVPKTCLGHHTGLREWWPRRVVLDWFHSRMDVLWHTVEDEKSITAHPKVSHKRQQATKEASTTCLVFYLAFSGILNMSANPEHPFHVACGNNKMLRDDPKEKGTPLDFGKQPSI